MKVSVIIAAYNAEVYLPETLDSIINQTMPSKDYEIIVINDGSTDSTEDILKKYSANTPNLKYKTIENSGVSGARNAALKLAQGEFVYFLDADDVADINALEQLYLRAQATNADLVIAKYDIFNKSRVFYVHNIDKLVKCEDIDNFDRRILWTFALWNKLFKRSIIEENKIEFQPVSYSEDGVFVMDYVFRCVKITGLDYTVLHYRRLNEEGNSITASVSKNKVLDYIKAHKMIFKIIIKAAAARSPELKENEIEFSGEYINYINEFHKKYAQILINQFYSKYGVLEEETIYCITDALESIIGKMSPGIYSWLQNEHPDLILNNLDKPNKTNNSPLFSCAVYFRSNETELINTLEALNRQNLVRFCIFLPESARKIAESISIRQDNIEYINEKEKSAFFKEALSKTKSEYITFCEEGYSYSHNAFKTAYKKLKNSNLDFISEVVYHFTYSEPQPIYISTYAKICLQTGIEKRDELIFDNIISNKFLRCDFLKQIGVDSFLEEPASIYGKGYSETLESSLVFYSKSEEDFLNSLNSEKAHSLKEKLYKPINHEKLSLNIRSFKNTSGFSLQKLIQLKEDNERDSAILNAINKYKNLKVENKALFFTIRADGKLTGNELALYPYVSGKKEICAKRLPHSNEEEDAMVKAIMTSKVIITDDYLKYLRYFPLKKEQRVIQLWHACGAFKKFGLRGTNLSPIIEKATHSQYNLVSVSGTKVMDIYADTFNIDISKVQPLGCPETDIFFNKKQAKKIKKAVFKAYKNLRKKEIILYAPTFRDNGVRQIFKPKLDFERLSNKLNKNQVLIICPHPIMKNKIIDKDYKNIFVIRDFTTKQLMLISDMMITDYSSVIFEYSLLNKPMAFYCYDYEIYNRSFYLRYPDDLPGPVLKTQDELERYLTNKKLQSVENSSRFRKDYMNGCDGNSCSRIAGIINSYMEI